MASLTHPTPGDLMKDEEKFIKIFSKKSLLVCLVACVPGFFLWRILAAFGIKIIGLILWIGLVIVCYVATTYRMPVEGNVYSGGGLFLYEVWLRKFYRATGKTVYIKHYEDMLQTRKDISNETEEEQ